MTLLVDASVAIKWIAREPDSERANALLLHDLAAPDFLLIELTNILWKKVRKGELVEAQALAGLATVQDTLEFLPVRGLERRALEIGLMLQHATYDCFYLALGELVGMRVLTADLRFAGKCKGTIFASYLEPFA